MSRLPLTFVLLVGVCLVGCQSTSESASSNKLTNRVGNYPPPPVGLLRPRVGVPPMAVASDASAGMEVMAADQLATLMVRTDRFDVIERGQLQMLLDEQDLEGIVVDGQLARPAAVQGVDYLLIGKITNLRTKATKTGSESGLGKVISFATGGIGGGVDIDSEKVEMKVECGVDLRLVDPSTGSVLDASFSDYTRTDKASAFGIQVLGVGAEADAQIEMSEDDKGLVLRLAFDNALHKMLPSLDRKLMNRTRDLQAASGDAAPAAAPAGDGDNDAKAAFCSQCGAKLSAGAAFCPNCGAKVGG
jgi:curli biogenesis system outer membrane secretion channel CsgG